MDGNVVPTGAVDEKGSQYIHLYIYIHIYLMRIKEVSTFADSQTIRTQTQFNGVTNDLLDQYPYHNNYYCYFYCCYYYYYYYYSL